MLGARPYFPTFCLPVVHVPPHPPGLSVTGQADYVGSGPVNLGRRHGAVVQPWATSALRSRNVLGTLLA